MPTVGVYRQLRLQANGQGAGWRFARWQFMRDGRIGLN
jgi:hypothetical protein